MAHNRDVEGLEHAEPVTDVVPFEVFGRAAPPVNVAMHTGNAESPQPNYTNTLH